MLSGLRVLDLTREPGFLAGKILADLGADVVKMSGDVRKPGLPRALRSELHPIAVRFWDSLGKSGQSQYYEPSDWILAMYTTVQMSTSLNSEKPTAALANAILALARDLGATDPARRRNGIEVDRSPEEEESDEPDALARALDRALTTDWNESSLVAAGSRRSWSVVADEMNGLFRQILENESFAQTEGAVQ